MAKTNTNAKTKTKTKRIEDPRYAIFSNCRVFKDTDAEITKINTKTYTKTMTNTKCIEDPAYAIFSKARSSRISNMTRPDQDRSGQRREESNLADLILELTFLLISATSTISS